MRQKAQITLETMLATTAFLMIIMLGIGTVAFQKQEAEKFAQKEQAKSQSLKCAMAVNAFYSSGTEITGQKLNCVGEENGKVKTIGKGFSESSQTIAQKVTSKKIGEKSLLEVNTLDHYR